MQSYHTGICRSFNSMTSIATPFFRSSCTEPAYTTPFIDQFSGEPQSFQQANVQFLPDHQQPFNDSRYHWAPGYYNWSNHSHNHSHTAPFGMFDARNKIWRNEYARIVQYAPRDYQDSQGHKCPVQPYVVLDEHNQPHTVCPVFLPPQSQPQCQTALNTLFQCERFRDTNPKAYETCKSYQNLLYYNIVTPNGQLIPLAYDMDGQGPKVYQLAMKKALSICGECKNT